MRVTYKYMNPSGPLAGKMILRPETPEEAAELERFREHVNSPQQGHVSFEIVFKRRLAGPRDIERVVRHVHEHGPVVAGAERLT